MSDNNKKHDNHDNKAKADIPPERDFIAKTVYRGGLIWTKTFTDLSFSGQENLPEDPPYVLAPNHQTYIDGLWVFRGLKPEHFKKTCAMVGKDMQYKHGLIGKLASKVARPVFVNREGNPVRSLIEAKKVMQEGLIIMVHPEGTRTRTGLIGKLHDGASFLAKKAKAPLVPVFISGGYECFSRYDKRPKRRNNPDKRRNKINVHYGKPLMPEDYDSNKEMTAALLAWYKDREKEYFEAHPQARSAEKYFSKLEINKKAEAEVDSE